MSTLIDLINVVQSNNIHEVQDQTYTLFIWAVQKMTTTTIILYQETDEETITYINQLM